MMDYYDRELDETIHSNGFNFCNMETQITPTIGNNPNTDNTLTKGTDYDISKTSNYQGWTIDVETESAPYTCQDTKYKYHNELKVKAARNGSTNVGTSFRNLYGSGKNGHAIACATNASDTDNPKKLNFWVRIPNFTITITDDYKITIPNLYMGQGHISSDAANNWWMAVPKSDNIDVARPSSAQLIVKKTNADGTQDQILFYINGSNAHFCLLSGTKNVNFELRSLFNNSLINLYNLWYSNTKFSRYINYILENIKSSESLKKLYSLSILQTESIEMQILNLNNGKQYQNKLFIKTKTNDSCINNIEDRQCVNKLPDMHDMHNMDATINKVMKQITNLIGITEMKSINKRNYRYELLKLYLKVLVDYLGVKFSSKLLEKYVFYYTYETDSKNNFEIQFEFLNILMDISSIINYNELHFFS